MTAHSLSRHAPPAALAERFELAALESDPSTIALVSGSGAIRWVNDAYCQFARANGAPEVPARFGVGASYLDGIHGPLRDDFAARLDACAARAEPFELDYECSSAERERHFRLRALPLPDRTILLVHHVLVDVPMSRSPSAPVERLYVTDAGFVVQCSNCRRVRRATTQQWDWVPAWAAKPSRRTSHGICPPCVGYYYGDYAPRT